MFANSLLPHYLSQTFQSLWKWGKPMWWVIYAFYNQWWCSELAKSVVYIKEPLTISYPLPYHPTPIMESVKQSSWVRDSGFCFRIKNNYCLTQIVCLLAPFPTESGARCLKNSPRGPGYPPTVPLGWLARFFLSQLVLSWVTQPEENCFLMEP